MNREAGRTLSTRRVQVLPGWPANLDILGEVLRNSVFSASFSERSSKIFFDSSRSPRASLGWPWWSATTAMLVKTIATPQR